MKTRVILKIGIVFITLVMLGSYTYEAELLESEKLTSAGCRALLQSIWDNAYQEGALDALDEIYAPEIIVHTSVSRGIQSLDSMKDGIKQVRKAFSHCRLMIDAAIMADDMMVTRWTFEGTGAMKSSKQRWSFTDAVTGEVHSVKVSIPAGSNYTQSGCTVMRMRHGKVVESWQYERTIAPILAQAGIELRMEQTGD